MEEKRQILKLIGSNHSLKDETLHISLLKPFQVMEGLEKIPVMSGQLDEVRTFFVKNDATDFFPSIIKEKIELFKKHYYCSNISFIKQDG